MPETCEEFHAGHYPKKRAGMTGAIPEKAIYRRGIGTGVTVAIVWLAGTILLYGPSVMPGGSVIPGPPGTFGLAILPGLTGSGVGDWLAGITLP
jgi:hypothetical protein